MADDLKHLEEHSGEIHELVETLVQNHLFEAANANQYCPKCVAVTLLEWAVLQSARHCRAMDQGRQERHQVDAAVMPFVTQQCRPAPAACTRL